ncbi:HAT [Nesidiocoris tenuis]|uniref:HAT n=1 Tax=Nesidiocoris tenuis TaxID=355587 RepID=A0ABN7AGB7_9HEMI|nr:HAT [Nesidiocoris tenuis]
MSDDESEMETMCVEETGRALDDQRNFEAEEEDEVTQLSSDGDSVAEDGGQQAAVIVEHDDSNIADGENTMALDEELSNQPDNTDAKDSQVEEEEHFSETTASAQGYEEPADAGKENPEPDTEMVSEDEFPAENVKQLDTEAVSDEELQEMPADALGTEDVSDDELPPPVKKKRKHRHHSSSEDDHSSSDKDKDGKKKKRKHESSEKKSKSSRSSKEKKREKSKSPSKSRGSRESSPKRKTHTSKSSGSTKSKTLPELEKYWKAVRDDPADFTGWTYLLQYVDQESDVEAAREAYDAFLRIYPYCYGYWRKYAEYERSKGDKSKCEEVFSRGLKAIPLSVDLWLHYLTFCKSSMKDNEEALRKQFERAIDRCGLEFRSDRLWDFYISWESDLKNYQNVFAIYDRLLATPVLGFKTHFDNFSKFVQDNQPNKILSVDEFLELRAEAVQKIKEKGLPNADPTVAPPPGDDLVEEEPNPASVDEETKIMRDKIIALRRKIFKNTANEVAKRWKFEEAIKRPYFHVKPLETAQLNTWRDYLDFEISTGDVKRAVILFERCLIACAMYEEFWLKYIRYLECSDSFDDLVRNVYQRACLIHHCKKPYLALEWAAFEESKCNIEEARKVLNHIEKQVPNMLLVFVRRINLERRVKNLEGAAKLYEYYLKNNNRNRYIYTSLSAKYSYFCHLVLNDIDKAIDVLNKAVEKYPDEIKLYIALLNMYMKKQKPVQDCLTVYNKVLEKETFDPETRIKFAQQKIEMLEDYGANVGEISKAHREFSALVKQIMEHGKGHNSRDDKTGSDDSRSKVKNENHGPPQSSMNSGSPGYTNANYTNNYQGGGQAYGGGNSGQYSSQASYNATEIGVSGMAERNSSEE